MHGERVRRRVIAHGRVQGVNFRYACRHEATRRGVAGWVWNRSDGAVEAVFEGPPDQVDAMVEWMHRGPPAAVVRHVDVLHEPAEGLDGFLVG